MSYAINQDRAKQSVMNSIAGLMQDLQKLASHPDQPNNKGPIFIKGNSNFKVANDHDGMLGNMILEGLLGTAFSEAVSESVGSWTEEVDISSAMECYSEYITDVEGSTQRTAAHGQGTLARLSSKPIASSFNMRSAISSDMQSFMDDLPKRMKIERNLAYYAKQLDQLDAQTSKHEIEKPRFAA